MKFLSVGKTIVTYQENPLFVLVNENSEKPVSRRLSLGDLAKCIRSLRSTRGTETWLVKNDVPSIIWITDDTLSDTVLECERLSPAELQDLAKLLRQ